MLFEIESKKTIDQVCQDLEKAVVNHKFGDDGPQSQRNNEEKGG